MRKTTLLIFSFFCLHTTAFSLSANFWNRLVVGGNFGAQFGDITLIQVAPTVGYKLTDEWIAGIGARYMHLNNRIDNYKTDIYGGSVFSQYYFLESFIAHAEVETLNLDAFNIIDRRLERVNVTSVLVGGGLRLASGGNSFFTLLALWNLNKTPESPYVDPIIRAGFAVGI